MSVQSINTGKISLAQLRAAVKGRDPALPRGLAMLQLRESHFQNAHRDFEALLENENESPQIRSLAALHLGRMATPASRDILVKNIHVSEERVLLSIIQSLARVLVGHRNWRRSFKLNNMSLIE
jgi:HEAT repeat protein